MKPMTDKHYAVLRRHMMELIALHTDLMDEEIGKGALDPRVMEAMGRVPRHRFVPPQLAPLAYHDTPLPIGFGKTISQPLIGALMLDLLALEPGQSVLEVGTGFGYQATVMAEMGARVWSVEIVEEFAAEAQERLRDLAVSGVTVRVGDGSRGWTEHAPFDRILVTAAADRPPKALLDQLKPDGRMVIPLGPGEAQALSVVTKGANGDAQIQAVMPVRFTQLETVI